jgi:hypothetical protein
MPQQTRRRRDPDDEQYRPSRKEKAQEPQQQFHRDYPATPKRFMVRRMA